MNSNLPKKTWKTKIEDGFGHTGLIISKHPRTYLIACITLIFLIATQLVHIRADSSIEGFLNEGDQKIVQYNKFKDMFGKDQAFIINIEVEDIFDPTFIQNLRDFHQQLENEVPYVKTVDSLVNARHTYGRDDTLFIEDLLPEQLPTDPVELNALKEYTYNSPTYRNYLISEDKHLSAVLVKLDAFRYDKNSSGEFTRTNLEEKDLKKSFEAINSIIEQHTGVLSDDIRVAGSLPITILLGKIVQHDFTVFSLLAILIIGSALALIFRRASGVVMPLVITIFGIICTISMMAALDTPIQMSTSILPSFLLAVCVGDSIHLLAIFYKRYDAGEEKIAALQYAMSHTGLAIFFTSITTAAGLASFSTSSLSPIAALGTFGAIGSIFAFLLSVLILPCLICIFPLKRKPPTKVNASALEALLKTCIHLSTNYPKPIILISLVLFFGSAYLASQLKFSHHPLDWLPADNPTILAIKKHEARMSGNSVFEVMLDTGKSRGIVNSEFLNKLESSMREIETWNQDGYSISKTISVTDIIKESNRALHDNDETHYRIPEDSDLIAQELFLVELDKPDDLYSYIDQNYQIARLTIILPWVDSIYYTPLIDRLHNYLNSQLKPYTNSITITGVSAVLGGTFSAMLYSTAESYAIAGILISLMMIILVGNFKIGLLNMIPSVLPIVMVMALLQLIGQPLDLFTMIIGSIAIGLTVDDNVHFIHGFRREYLKTGSPKKAIEETLLSTGRAMLVTTVVLSAGFLVYSQSALKNLVGFGLLTALCISLALIATFLLAPSLMMLSSKEQPRS